MLWTPVRLLCAFLAVHLGLGAADITGRVVVTHRLTKRNVTPQASAYQRGAAVELMAEPPADPLEYERRHVAIYLEGHVPSHPINTAMEQKGRAFSPDMLVVPVGSEVSFPNLDLIFHNVFSLSKPKSFDLGNYAQWQSRVVVFSKPGVVFVHCRLHPNMAGQIVVTPNSWSTLPDAAGRFALTGVPPGEYTVVAWSKAAGELRHTVTVTEGRGAEVEFLVPLGDAAPALAAKGSRR